MRQSAVPEYIAVINRPCPELMKYYVLKALATNIAARVRTPKMKQRLPDVMSAEKTNNLIDASEPIAKERDLAILELLYGCGIRVSELVGIDLEDVDLSAGWLRVIVRATARTPASFTR